MPKDFSSLTDPPHTRGIVNNNPGNIRPGDSWVGMKGTSNNFVVFENVGYGLRALAIDLSNKIKNGYDTIEKIITRYAPPEENDTDAYINAVSADTGFNSKEQIALNVDNLAGLMRAIVNHEQGNDAGMIDDDDILEGIQMMPQSWLDKLKAVFVNSPVTAAVAGYGIAVAAIIIVIIVVAVFAKKKIKLPYE